MTDARFMEDFGDGSNLPDDFGSDLDLSDPVNHPPHYGGADNPYEAIKVIDAWNLGFSLGNAVKYICRAGKKDNTVQDLKKARFYLDHAIKKAEANEHF